MDKALMCCVLYLVRLRLVLLPVCYRLDHPFFMFVPSHALFSVSYFIQIDD